MATMILVYRLLILSNDVGFSEHLALLALVIGNTMIIMAGGNVINDILDIGADRYNKPQKWYVGNVISKRGASLFYLVLLLISLLITLTIYIKTANRWLLIVFLASMILLFFYSRILKKIPLVGNFVVALLCVLSLWITPLTFSSDTKSLLPLTNHVHSILLALSFFAWLTSIMREMVKDVQDKQGDKQASTRTLAHLLALTTLKNILVILDILIILGLVALIPVWSEKLHLVSIVYLYGLLLGAVFLLYRISIMKKLEDWSRMSVCIKIYMVQGLIFLGLV
jgi:4-hydroxybenzoate polyprenyltransferase